MLLTRRALLAGGSAVLAVTLGQTVAASAASAKTTGGGLRRSTFTPLRGRTLTAAATGRRASVRLAGIRDVRGAAAGSEHSFALQFTSRQHLPDGIYTLTHPRAGAHHLFVSGVGAGSGHYEAVVFRTPN